MKPKLKKPKVFYCFEDSKDGEYFALKKLSGELISHGNSIFRLGMIFRYAVVGILLLVHPCFLK